MTQNKRTTMNDIAMRLGISKNSVSLALNGKAGVSEELRRRIIETAAEMEYGSYSAQSTSIRSRPPRRTPKGRGIVLLAAA